MKKNILFGNDVVVEMSLEEVVARFSKQVTYFAKRCEYGISGSDFTREDYEQIGYMALVEAFINYDDNYVFSTYFDTKLKGERTKIISKIQAGKRRANLVSLDEPTKESEDNTSLSDIIGTLDDAIEDLAGDDLVSIIFSKLNEEEKLMYLNIVEQGIRPVDYAKQINISKQSLNYKLNKLKEKLLTLYNMYNVEFGIC